MYIPESPVQSKTQAYQPVPKTLSKLLCKICSVFLIFFPVRDILYLKVASDATQIRGDSNDQQRLLYGTNDTQNVER